MSFRIFKYWPVILLLSLSVLTVWPIFMPGYFSHHDDLQVMRIFEMRRCFEDLQIPCRWVSDLGYGNGFPLYNYYPVFPYYLGAILSYLFGFIGSSKVLFLIPLVLGGVSMYILGKRLWGELGGFASGVLYLFAPYRALDSYVRGAVAESFSLSLIPLVFYFSLNLIKKNNLSSFIFLTLFFSLFLLSHNIMVILFLPFFILWILIILVKEKFKTLTNVLSSLGLGFGMAAFFLIPAFLEKDLVQSESLIKFNLDFRVHFVTLKQLFLDRVWGYGASVYGPNDSISFQIGWPHWWLVVISMALIVLMVFKRKFDFKFNLMIYFLLLFILSAFMSHNKSAFIWEKLPTLQYAQFPWRFLSFAIFSSSLIGGGVISFLTKRFQVWSVVVLVLFTVLLNWKFFKPDVFYPNLTDTQKLTGLYFEEQQKAGVLDYLPKTALEPKERSANEPIIREGNALISGFNNRSNRWRFNVFVKDRSTIEVPVFDFPFWQVKVNGQSYKHSISDIGRISLNLNPGNYEVAGSFNNTLLRTVSNLITLASFLLFLIYIHANFRKNR